MTLSSALDEFTRLLKPGGVVILTAPFASNVYIVPYHYCSGFFKYWYEHHLEQRGFARTVELLFAQGYSMFTEDEAAIEIASVIVRKRWLK